MIFPMTKTQLVDKIAKDTELTKKQAAEAVDAMIAAMQDALAAGEGVQLVGFGGFSVKDVAARTGRNPKTNEVVEIPASRRVTFSASKTLKDKVNA